MKEMWDKLEVTYEGTTKVKEARISSLVNECELFKMAEDENIEYMFLRCSKIVCKLNHFEWCIQLHYKLENSLEVSPRLGKLKLPFLKMEET